MTKKLPLTQGKFAIVDDDVYEWASEYKWHTLRGRNTFYAVRKTGIWPIRKDSYLHREIMQAQPNVTVDHVNHNGLDCRRTNMRLCTQKENTHNRRRRSDNKSGFKGVYQDKGRSKWRAEIKVDGKKIYLGSFVVPEDAARAYDEAAHKHHGEFAKTNF